MKEVNMRNSLIGLLLVALVVAVLAAPYAANADPFNPMPPSPVGMNFQPEGEVPVQEVNWLLNEPFWTGESWIISCLGAGLLETNFRWNAILGQWEGTFRLENEDGTLSPPLGKIVFEDGQWNYYELDLTETPPTTYILKGHFTVQPPG